MPNEAATALPPQAKADEAQWESSSKLVVELIALLDAPIVDEEKSEWLLPIVHWLSKRSRVLLPKDAQLSADSPAARLWLCVRVLKTRPARASRLGGVIRSLLDETTAVHLFCDAGMGGQRSFASEAVGRITTRILPAAPDDRHLDEVIALLFPDKKSARWLVTLPDPLLKELWHTIFALPNTVYQEPWALLRDDMADAIIVLGGRVAAHGMENDVRVRSGPPDLRDSPFFTLSQICREAAELSRTTSDRALAQPQLDRLHIAIERSRKLLARAVAHQEANGVSVDLVHRLERMSRQLVRIEQLSRMLFPEELETAAQGRRLFATLVLQATDDRSLLSLVRGNVRLLSRKIVESASATGEHYIASSRNEYRGMLRSAAWAGLLTAGTTLIKYSIADLSLPPFFLGLFSSLNYAISFLILYFCGWTLATKQPAATAATLAHSMQRLETDADLERMVEQIACTTRSQIAAIAGNLCTVIPGAVALDLLWHAISHHHFFNIPEANHALKSLHPLRSMLILYAALTGVLLWASSIIAGWVNNWASYRRLPEAIGRSRTLLATLGLERRARLATFFTKNISGIAGNIALGFLLGMAPFVGAFFGAPTEIRHVTISSGLITFAAAAFGTSGVAQPAFFWAVLGIGIIGLFNFAVSFRLAIWLASRACDIDAATMAKLRRALARDFWRSPGRFLLPPPETKRADNSLTIGPVETREPSST